MALNYAGPSSWTDLGLNWNNPDPGNVNYFIAIQKAMQERVSILSVIHSLNYDLSPFLSPFQYKSAEFADDFAAFIKNIAPFFLPERVNNYNTSIVSNPNERLKINNRCSFQEICNDERSRINRWPSCGTFDGDGWADWLKCAKNAIDKLKIVSFPYVMIKESEDPANSGKTVIGEEVEGGDYENILKYLSEMIELGEKRARDFSGIHDNTFEMGLSRTVYSYSVVFDFGGNFDDNGNIESRNFWGEVHHSCIKIIKINDDFNRDLNLNFDFIVRAVAGTVTETRTANSSDKFHFLRYHNYETEMVLNELDLADSNLSPGLNEIRVPYKQGMDLNIEIAKGNSIPAVKKIKLSDFARKFWNNYYRHYAPFYQSFSICGYDAFVYCGLDFGVSGGFNFRSEQ